MPLKHVKHLPAKEVPGLSRVGVGLQRLLQTLDGIAVPAGSLPELFHCVMHPAFNTFRQRQKDSWCRYTLFIFSII